MEITLYNSLIKKREKFIPLVDKQVSMYVCGPTVYNYIHIGNLRPVVVFDVLRRFLIHLGYDVVFVSNYTDVDDKVIEKAQADGVSELEIADKYINAYEQNLADVNAMKPTHSPRVTNYIPEIISFVEKLISLGAAYEVEGNVYFQVSKDVRYGELGNFDPAELQAGARIEEDSKKESPLDFVIWKKTEVGIKWNSPWGLGRPGWHTECVVMIDSIFPNKYIDIHGGGFDLKFPHHENEIAQSLAVNNNKLAHFWMHNGFINIEQEKMSKSLGNVVLAKDALEKFGGNVVRMLLLSTHYRAPVNFSEEVIEASQNEINKISNTYRQLAVTLQKHSVSLTAGHARELDAFLLALADDLNTSNALAELYRVLKLVNLELRKRDFNLNELANLFQSLTSMLAILGFKIDYPLLTNEDYDLLKQYEEARAAKNFALSDELRAKLAQRNLI